MGFNIAYSIILNMSVLLLFAQLITKISFVKEMIIENKKSLKTKFILIYYGIKPSTPQDQKRKGWAPLTSSISHLVY